MLMNNNDPMRNVILGGPSPFVNSGEMQPQPMFQNHSQMQLLSQSQPHARSGHHFQLSEPQSQLLVSQSPFGQAGATNIRFQSPSHFQGANTSNLGFGNSNVSLPLIPTPGTGSSAKRANQKAPSRPAASSNPSAASPLKTMELTPAAPRRKRKLHETERQIHDKVASLLPESALYTQLLEFEERVDAILVRKKIEIQDAVKNPSRVQKTLRIYVFNTFANQTGITSENKDAEPPSWSLKIVGRILEDGKEVGGLMQNPSIPQPKFSSFFKKITIYLDQNLYPDNHVILWESNRASSLHGGFEVRRRGGKECRVAIRLEMNYVPEKFKLSSALSEVLGLEVETRPRILAAIWFYVKAKKLQSPSDPSFFICDPPLQNYLEWRRRSLLWSQK